MLIVEQMRLCFQSSLEQSGLLQSHWPVSGTGQDVFLGLETTQWRRLYPPGKALNRGTSSVLPVGTSSLLCIAVSCSEPHLGEPCASDTIWLCQRAEHWAVVLRSAVTHGRLWYSPSLPCLGHAGFLCSCPSSCQELCRTPCSCAGTLQFTKLA